ncbi:hypothetical protein CK203_093903 [Vitis vinifera]|uniref:Uncharacterized protein n=1 Tax=Vitis vinifera TaxID=29760 RepID=A0A438C8C7_VITVI|nr:hypothetical protein CK203_093903 [Vitis vinifera]
MEETKTMKTLMSSSIKIDKDEKVKSIDSTMYRASSDIDPSPFSIVKVSSVSLIAFFLLFLDFHGSMKESIVAKAQDKRPVELSWPKAHQKVWFDTTLFSTIKGYQWYKQHFAQRQ